MTRRQTIAELAHFSPPAPMILVSLAGGPKHGYAIIEDVRALSGVTIGAGTLYAVLQRLEKLGLVEALPADERRLPYRLTPAGRIALRWHLEGVRAVVEAGLTRLAGSSGQA